VVKITSALANLFSLAASVSTLLVATGQRCPFQELLKDSKGGTDNESIPPPVFIPVIPGATGQRSRHR
jgi:hypothetical protein